MILQKDQFPITIQAYEISNDSELFIAEQVVNNQAEVDLFSTRYAGKLIKAKATSVSGTTGTTGRSETTGTTRTAATSGTNTVSTKTGRKSSAATIIIVIVILLLILLAIAYYTGWLQRTTGVDL